MALSREEKEVIVTEVSEVAASALSAVTAEYSGISATEMTDLHAKSRDNGVYLRVVKNTLAKRAVLGTEFECMADSFSGPLVMAFSQEDPGAAARVMKDFAKENSKLVVKSLSVGGQLLGPQELDRLASLPTKDQAIAMLMSVMQAPISKFVRTLAEPHTKLVRTIAAVGDQKQATA
ncbi:LSU ribosomal protein L10p (P0) [hydrothermal vent metagenome]|uniref:LSU ribosomal protein L10p (P0) n=1 Tax=hydrothermal vent metagenome TaxID=652676 RepID=A0A3B1AA76_9ZZZZ